MIEIGYLIIIVILIAGGILSAYLGVEKDEPFFFLYSIVSLIISVVMILFYGVIAFEWHASQYKADVINREFETHYTREEVFYADSVIDEIREIDRKRIEVNGNLMR